MAEGSSVGCDLEDQSDVPPLEDMSELIQQVNKLREDASAGSSTTQSTKTTDTQPKKKPESSAECFKSAESQKTFGGFKKGFLTNPKPRKGNPVPSSKSVKKDADIPVIRPKNPEEKTKGMEIPEVQEAMKSTIPSLENKDWITEDLLKKIESNPSLAKLLMDPMFTAALSQVQTDPMKAVAMLESHPEMQKALQDFSGILGDHFTSLPGSSSAGMKPTTSNSQENNIGLSERSSTRQQPPVPPSPDDEAKMREILSDPEVMKVLQDHQIQRLLTLMKTNPEAAQLEVKNATPETRAKIQKLVDVGLLGFAQ
ncbi:hypothetical protein OS493_013671 [Desmophyllum pertusum]|uniref:STI1 domain-containing protein n=1 Tax=Desmophyllum pertusum TaxID=174260 RepID=A0A9X0D3Y4_9CNID|nr:hypothetical protein OS493_013671 [Desmophyllum pertusum]